MTANFKQPRLRNEKYLRSLREMPCLSCGIAPAGVAHHLLRAEERGVGLKTGDNHAVPMCTPCHTRLHMNGVHKEKAPNGKGYSLDMIAKEYKVSPTLVKTMIEEHVTRDG